LISTVSGTYPDIAWDISPTAANGKLEMPQASVEVCNVQYQLEAAEFDLKDGTVYLTPDGYAFAPDTDETGGASLTKFPNGEKYWACAVKIEDGKENIQVLKAVKA
jgi:hypothetical protein